MGFTAERRPILRIESDSVTDLWMEASHTLLSDGAALKLILNSTDLVHESQPALVFPKMRRALSYGLLIALVLALLGGTIAYFYGKRQLHDLGPRARQRIVHALAERFDADVDLKSVAVTMYPHPKAIGEELTIRHKGWTQAQPLIYIRRFTAETDYDTLIAKRNHVDIVRLEGLEIHIPPQGRSAFIQKKAGAYEIETAQPGQDRTQLKFLIDKITADGAQLEIEPKAEGKEPLHFDIEKLLLKSVGPGRPMTFNAELTNATPPGLIQSAGTFGPWQRDDPRATAVSGNYEFQNADLAVFKGISGILSSTGRYQGVLQHIEINGTTDTPQFALKRGGEPIHLTTNFHSVVDGTNGDTILDPVDARFLHSHFVCRGGVVHRPGEPGKTVSLDALSKQAQIEDILQLIVGKGEPLLRGGVDFRSKILIPPDHKEVADKLNLNGQFAIVSANFTSEKVEQRLRTLSDRARGISKKQEEQEPRETVASNFEGQFKMADGNISFSKLTFSVPGAAINLTGTYNLNNEQIDFKGLFRMDATLSETQSGVKHWVLKPFDRFFEKDGAGLEVPIVIAGTKSDPQIGTEIFHKHITIH